MATNEFEHVARHMVLDRRPDYWGEIDEYLRGTEQFLLMHVRFARFTPHLFRTFLKEWFLFREIVTCPVYCYDTENGGSKWLKFITRLGFKPTDIVAGDRRLFIHEVGSSGNVNINHQ